MKKRRSSYRFAKKAFERQGELVDGKITAVLQPFCQKPDARPCTGGKQIMGLGCHDGVSDEGQDDLRGDRFEAGGRIHAVEAAKESLVLLKENACAGITVRSFLIFLKIFYQLIWD